MVAGVVRSWRDLVDHQRVISKHEELHGKSADVVQFVGDGAGDRFGVLCYSGADIGRCSCGVEDAV